MSQQGTREAAHRVGASPATARDAPRGDPRPPPWEKHPRYGSHVHQAPALLLCAGRRALNRAWGDTVEIMEYPDRCRN